MSRLVAIASLLLISATIALPAAATAPPLAGRWQRVTTCQELVAALRKAGLGPVAPAIVAGNGLVPGTPKQLSRKADICKGAVPRVHAHFFTGARQFGSLDWKGEPVDDGHWRIVKTGTVRINDGIFRYRILDGNKLMLTPVLTAAAIRRALAHPLQFSLAGWMVAVSYPGHVWKRVPCAGWC